MWKGTLRIDAGSVPVKLYAAVEDRDVHFHLLHDRDEQRVEQRLVHPETDEEVPKDQVRKGYPLEPGTFVLLDPDEVAELAPRASRDIRCEAFVPQDAIDPLWFERPYHLGPDGQASAYLALARALKREARQGIVRWVMRGKRYTGALRSSGAALQLIVLHDREEVLSPPDAVLEPARPPTAQEVALAEQLVTSLAAELDLRELRDEHRERLHEFLQQKARGKKVRLARPRKRRATGDSLVSALRSSVKRARSTRERKSA